MNNEETTKMPAPKTRIVKMSDLLRTGEGKIDTSANVRESVAYDRESLSPLIDSILTTREDQPLEYPYGIKEPPILMEDEKGLRVVQGHRRLYAAEFAGLTEFKASVYPKLTKGQFISLLIDHGHRQGLNEKETFFAAEREFQYGRTQKQIVADLRPLLELHNPMTDAQREKIGSDHQKLLEHYRGKIQTFQRAVECPAVVRDAYVRKLGKEIAYPANNELIEVHNVFIAECKEDVTCNRLKPGPKFWEKWNKIVTAREQAAAEGKKAISTGMKARKDIEASLKMIDSAILKLDRKNVLNDGVSDDDFKKVIEIQIRLEAALTEEDLILIRSFNKAPEPIKKDEQKAA